MNEEKEVVMREVGMQEVAGKYIQNESKREEGWVRACENPGNITVSDVGSCQTHGFQLHSPCAGTEVDLESRARACDETAALSSLTDGH